MENYRYDHMYHIEFMLSLSLSLSLSLLHDHTLARYLSTQNISDHDISSIVWVPLLGDWLITPYSVNSHAHKQNRRGVPETYFGVMPRCKV
jgi:hypothetical protein